MIVWCFMAFLVYKVQQFDYEYANFDPYDILGIGTVSTRKIDHYYIIRNDFSFSNLQ